ncbi:hypothetical protein [Streptomyces sp. NPDC093589]|uniref:hypothetical protein n=1 Tax=Streptomyces sp. NPDC093589 TaxID=3366043 RepID=UPI003822DF0C
MELRLIDPYGDTVPGTIYRGVPAQSVAEVTDRLRRDSAPKHADRWDGINGYAFHAADYHVQATSETLQPTATGTGTFLDLLATPAAA